MHLSHLSYPGLPLGVLLLLLLPLLEVELDLCGQLLVRREDVFHLGELQLLSDIGITSGYDNAANSRYLIC